VKIRCSALPLITTCAQAAQTPKTKIELGDPDIPSLGRAVHACQARRIRGQRVDLDELAAEFQVSLAELEPAAGAAVNAWASAKSFFPSPMVEEALYYRDDDLALELTGTADVLSIDGSEARILDWKTGWLETDATQQLKGYAFLTMRRFGVGVVHASIARPKSGKLFTQVWTAEDLAGWFGWLKEHLQDQAYRPSAGACGHCRRWLECDAGRELVKQSADTLIDLNGADLSPASMIEVIERARLVEQASKFARDLVKAAVIQAGGTLTAADGSSLEIMVQRPRTITLTAEGEAVLRGVIGDDIHKLTLGATEVDALVAAKAPSRLKKSNVASTMAALEKAGALTYEQQDRLVIKPAPKKIGASS
jgi:hypothetical protein